MNSLKSSLKPDEKNTQSLYTPEQRIRRDRTVWTFVQGILAPIQFLVFLISLFLVIRTLTTNEGYVLTTYSIIIKTLFLYAIMITGAIWEKVVFGKYLFAQSFFWEDVFSMLVLALHTLYLYGLFFSAWPQLTLLYIALAAYTTYVINAAQFILKLRKARLEASATHIVDSSDKYIQANTSIRKMGASV